MKVATWLLEVFLLAVVLALLVTVGSVQAGVKLLALVLVTPIVVLGLVFVRYCRRRRAWAFAGSSLLGAVGVALRLVISTRPSLEVGGGLPVWVTASYVLLGASMSLTSLASALELRTRRA